MVSIEDRWIDGFCGDRRRTLVFHVDCTPVPQTCSLDCDILGIGHIAAVTALCDAQSVDGETRLFRELLVELCCRVLERYAGLIR